MNPEDDLTDTEAKNHEGDSLEVIGQVIVERDMLGGICWEQTWS